MQRLLSFALTGFLVAMLASGMPAQSLKPAASVQQFVDRGGSFFSVPLFAESAAPGKDIDNAVEGAQFLLLDMEELKTLVERQPASLVLSLPYRGKTVEVELLKTDVLTPDFQVVTSESEDRGIPVDAGVHYRGRVQGQAHSVAAFSFFKNEVMGMMSDDVYGNRVLGRLDTRDNSDQYILYEDTKLKSKNPFFCGTEDVDQRDEPSLNTTEVNGCVRVYLEADYELFQNKGSVANVTSYLTGVFNQVAALYANEAISTQVSTIYVWTTADSYSNTSSSTALSQFRTTRTSFNGDIAHLASYGGNNLGGVAYVDVICNSAYRYAYSNISASYQNVPTYSWTVEVMTHEMGHNLGSNHTQWCGWTGGALDNCYTTETGCAAGPAPTNGGTIMSYCHLTSYGINFNNGFGTQPGNKIRTRVSAATCLAATCSSSTSCGTPTNLSASGIAQTSATLSWTAVSGSTSYNLQWKTSAATTWNTISGITTASYNLTGLIAGTTYNFKVQSNCSGTLGAYSATATFSTASAVSCGTPVGLSTSSIAQTSASLKWTALSGATSYNLQWKASSASNWTTVSNITSTTYNLSGLTSATSYQFQVQANCSGTPGAYSAPFTFTTTGVAACGVPAGLTSTSVTQISAVISWTSVVGATSYNVQWKTAAATTWTTVSGITATTYNLNGLLAGTTYNFKVQSNCSVTLSSYSAASSFTTAIASCPDSNEPNNSRSTASTIGVNANINAQIATTADIDWYRFSNTSTARNIKIDLTNLPANYDVRLYLNNTQLGISQNTGTASEQIIYNTSTVSTTYYVYVYGTGGATNSAQCYTLRVSLGASAWTQGLIGGGEGEESFEIPVVVQDADFAMYPNPADESVALEIPVADDNTSVSVSMMDISGRIVSQQQSELMKDANRLNLSLNGIADGVYFVHVRNGNQQSTRKLVVQH